MRRQCGVLVTFSQDALSALLHSAARRRSAVTRALASLDITVRQRDAKEDEQLNDEVSHSTTRHSDVNSG
jgi:hypothetical protein